MRPGVFPAGKATPCAVCAQQVQPGDLIIRVAGRMMLPMADAEMVYMPGAYAHEDCVWHGSPTSIPFLTWEQLDALHQIVTLIQLPKGEYRTRRLLGAARVAHFNKHHNKTWLPAEPALALGQELLDGYRLIMAMTDKTGAWFDPVGYDGKPWVGMTQQPVTVAERPPATLPVGATLIKRVETQEIHPMVAVMEERGLLDDGFWVRGTLITPVKFCMLTPINCWIRPMDKPGAWIAVPNYQLALTEADAAEDVERWLAKSAAAR